jgi:hypothetical protein
MLCLVSHGGGAAGPVRVHAHLSPRHRVPLRYDRMIRYDDQGAIESEKRPGPTFDSSSDGEVYSTL